MAFQKVAVKSEIGNGEIKRVEVGNHKIALINLNGTIFALSDVCNHAGCLLSEEGQVEGEEVECLCHGSKFDIRTGEVTAGPAFEPQKTYEVKVEGDNVFVEV